MGWREDEGERCGRRKRVPTMLILSEPGQEPGRHVINPRKSYVTLVHNQITLPQLAVRSRAGVFLNHL